jgi:asparagine synthase (glutamine-hydrolysing)
MLAFAWAWGGSSAAAQSATAQRIAASLCAGIGGYAGQATHGQLHFAYRPLRSDPRSANAWRPAILHDGRIAVFHGYLDNAVDIAAELDVACTDAARLYCVAVDRWGDDADKRIVGDYCSLIADPTEFEVRLARSPLRAPPLCYFASDELVAVSSVPRALFAAGVERRLNENRLADSARINFTDREVSWYEGVRRVPTDHIVELKRGRPRALRQYYDLFATPPVRLNSDTEYLERAGELLDEGVRACLRPFKRPGATLSAGLDTPQVVVSALRALPPEQKLPTFTFHPEPQYGGCREPGSLGDERPMVEAFAAMHSRLEPHFSANQGYGHDHRWAEFFHLMGGAPSGLCNMYVFHGPLADAAKCGCDGLLLAEWGNYTFSDKGDWGFVEYFLTGQWRQLWRAYRRMRHDPRPLPVRFLIRTMAAFLPVPIWRMAKRLYRRGGLPLPELMQPLSTAYRASSGAEARLKASGLDLDRYHPWNRRHAQQVLFATDDAEGAEIYQAFEQMYGVALRDPTAYRPFVEFCFGLPVRMFMRDGEMRWMAKQMAKGIMPEDQRENVLNGRWDADWHLRIGRRRAEYLAELRALEDDQRIGPMLDLPRLKAALEEWPDEAPVDPQEYFTPEFAVPRALLTARFIKYVEGRNM